MNIRKKLAAAAMTGAILTGGIALAAPASANPVQNACSDNSFKFFTSSAGYCWNGNGTTMAALNGVLSYCADQYDGTFWYTSSKWVNHPQDFSYNTCADLQGSNAHTGTLSMTYHL